MLEPNTGISRSFILLKAPRKRCFPYFILPEATEMHQKRFVFQKINNLSNVAYTVYKYLRYHFSLHERWFKFHNFVSATIYWEYTMLKMTWKRGRKNNQRAFRLGGFSRVGVRDRACNELRKGACNENKLSLRKRKYEQCMRKRTRNFGDPNVSFTSVKTGCAFELEKWGCVRFDAGGVSTTT